MPQQSNLDGKTIKLLQQSGVIKSITVVAEQSIIYVRYQLKNGETGVAHTTLGNIKQWSTIDASVKWLQTLGIGNANLNFSMWKSKQKMLKLASN